MQHEKNLPDKKEIAFGEKNQIQNCVHKMGEDVGNQSPRSGGLTFNSN